MPICTDGGAGLRPLKWYRGEGSVESAAIRGVMGSWEERDCLLNIIYLASSGFGLDLT